MYKCKHFKIYELVPQEVFGLYDEWRLWLMFDERILRAIDMLREKFGACNINDWKWDGKFHNRGLRLPEYYKVPSASQHLYGRAFDLVFKNATPEEVRLEIISNSEKYLPFIKRIEKDTKTWTHIDCGNDLYGDASKIRIVGT